MRLTEIKAKAVEKAKLEEAARDHEKLMRELDVHPLVKLKTERSVRDAYFYGIVFAALLDDLKVDSTEFKIVSRIGHSLEIDNSTQQDVVKDVEQTVAEAVAAGGQDVDVLLKETLSIVSDEHARLLFLAEFVKVCGAKELHVADVESILAPCMPELKKKEAYFKTVCKIVQEGEGASRADLLRLTEDLTDDEVRYWMLDVKGDVMDGLALERQAIAQAKKSEEQKRAKEEQDVRERVEQQARLDAALTNIAERYGQRKAMSDNIIRKCKEMVQGIDAEKIDWMKPVNDILKEPLTPRPEIWKLAGLLLIENPDVKEELSARRCLVVRSGLGVLGGARLALLAGLCASDRGSKWLELEVLCEKCFSDFQGAFHGFLAATVAMLETHTSREQVKKFITKYLAKRVTFK